MLRWYMRTVAASSIIRMRFIGPPGILINNGFREFAHLVQRGDATHRFRMAQADKAAGFEGVIKRFGGRLARHVIEINQQVAAKNYIEIAVWPGIAGLRKICLLYTSPSPRDGLLSRMPSSA